MRRRASRIWRAMTSSRLAEPVSFRDEIERLISGFRSGTANCPRCCSSISTASSRSTTRSATPAAINCSARSRAAARHAASGRLRRALRRRRVRWCSSATIRSNDDAPCWRAGSSTSSASATRSTIILVEIGASVGIAHDWAGISADTLLKNATWRCTAPRRGTGLPSASSATNCPDGRGAPHPRARSAQGVANEEFELFYQPWSI